MRLLVCRACTRSSSPLRSIRSTCALVTSTPALRAAPRAPRAALSLTSARELQSPGRGHVRRVGVDRLAPWGSSGWSRTPAPPRDARSARPVFFASIAAAMPETPPPMIARSRTVRRPAAGASCEVRPPRRWRCTARAPVSAENLSSGNAGQVADDAHARQRGRAVVHRLGSFSTVPAGQPVCSQFM